MNLLKKVHLLLNLSMAIGLSYTFTTPVFAAEEIFFSAEKIFNDESKIKVKVSDIEKIAQAEDPSSVLIPVEVITETGGLLLLESITPPSGTKEALNRPISMDLSKPLTEEQSDRIKFIFPLEDPQIDEAMKLLAEKANGMTILQVLKALPVKTITPENLISTLANWNPKKADVVTNIPANVVANILYLNSTRGIGTGYYGNYRSPIANTLENYQNGTIFDVDFVQTHVSGNLAYWLNSKPIGYYNQIWFDTTIYVTSLLNAADLAALNSWAFNKQPEFILDSSFFVRNHYSNTLSASAAAVTISEALALKNKGGGIFIGTDHNDFAYTANQILTNFGFDGLFTGVYYITANGSFVGDLLLDGGSVSPDFFTNNLQGLSTSAVPIGKHTLNENGGNRNIEIFESLFSYSPGKIAHVGASFNIGMNTTDIRNPKSDEFGVNGIKFEENKTIKFDFTKSQGHAISKLGIFEMQNNLPVLVKSLFEEQDIADPEYQDNAPDGLAANAWLGTAKNLKGVATNTFTFLANKIYTLGLLGNDGGKELTPVFSTSSLNKGGFQFAAFGSQGGQEGQNYDISAQNYQSAIGLLNSGKSVSIAFNDLILWQGENNPYWKDDRDFNDFVVTAQEVPEPVSIIGMTLGILGAIYTRRRR